MDAFLGFLVLLGIVVAFVAMVRRTNAAAQKLGSGPVAVKRPEILSPEQRKALNLKPRLSRAQTVSQPTKPSDKSAATRAIRTGWSIGTVAFTYQDSAGAISDRLVSVHAVGRTYLKGECLDKNVARTFRLDRIQGELTHCETGELIHPKDWAKAHA